jgi:hypothetical protein
MQLQCQHVCMLWFELLRGALARTWGGCSMSYITIGAQGLGTSQQPYEPGRHVPFQHASTFYNYINASTVFVGWVS